MLKIKQSLAEQQLDDISDHLFNEHVPDSNSDIKHNFAVSCIN